MARQNPLDGTNPRPLADVPVLLQPVDCPAKLKADRDMYLPSQRFSLSQQLYPSLYRELSPIDARATANMLIANPILALPVMTTPPVGLPSGSDDDYSIHEYVYHEPLICAPKRFLAQVEVRDAISTLRLNSDTVFELRRKYHGNVEVSRAPFKPLSKKASSLTMLEILPDLLEALMRVQVNYKDKTPKLLIEYLESVGIPESHQSFLNKILLRRELKYWSVFVLFAVYFYIDPPIV